MLEEKVGEKIWEKSSNIFKHVFFIVFFLEKKMDKIFKKKCFLDFLQKNMEKNSCLVSINVSKTGFFKMVWIFFPKIRNSFGSHRTSTDEWVPVR